LSRSHSYSGCRTTKEACSLLPSRDFLCEFLSFRPRGHSVGGILYFIRNALDRVAVHYYVEAPILPVASILDPQS
jgi:hypothetical protein